MGDAFAPPVFLFCVPGIGCTLVVESPIRGLVVPTVGQEQGLVADKVCCSPMQPGRVGD